MLFKCHFHEKFKNSVIEKPESEKKFVPFKNHQNIKFWIIYDPKRATFIWNSIMNEVLGYNLGGVIMWKPEWEDERNDQYRFVKDLGYGLDR